MKKATSIITKNNEALQNFYDRKLLQSIRQPNPFLAKVKWRKVKVPKYFTIKLPVIDRVVDEGGNVGYRIILQEFDLFRIGTKIEEQPYYPKTKNGEAIKFRRYGDLNVVFDRAKGGVVSVNGKKVPQSGK
jgi:hypothetical protein